MANVPAVWLYCIHFHRSTYDFNQPASLCIHDADCGLKTACFSSIRNPHSAILCPARLKQTVLTWPLCRIAHLLSQRLSLNAAGASPSSRPANSPTLNDSTLPVSQVRKVGLPPPPLVSSLLPSAIRYSHDLRSSAFCSGPLTFSAMTGIKQSFRNFAECQCVEAGRALCQARPERLAVAKQPVPI